MYVVVTTKYDNHNVMYFFLKLYLESIHKSPIKLKYQSIYLEDIEVKEKIEWLL